MPFFLVPVMKYLTEGDLSKKEILLAYIYVGTEYRYISSWQEGQGKRIGKPTDHYTSIVREKGDKEVRPQDPHPAISSSTGEHVNSPGSGSKGSDTQR